MAKKETNRGKLARCAKGLKGALNQETRDQYAQQIEGLYLELGSVVGDVLGLPIGRVQVETQILPLVKAVEAWRRAETTKQTLCSVEEVA